MSEDGDWKGKTVYFVRQFMNVVEVVCVWEW